MLNKAVVLDNRKGLLGNRTFATEVKPLKGAHISQQREGLLGIGWLCPMCCRRGLGLGHHSPSSSAHSITSCGAKTFVFSNPVHPFLGKCG